MTIIIFAFSSPRFGTQLARRGIVLPLDCIVLIGVTRRAYSPKGFVGLPYSFLKNLYGTSQISPPAPMKESLVCFEKTRDRPIFNGRSAGYAIAQLAPHLFRQALVTERP